jgi:hypothetical protein
VLAAPTLSRSNSNGNGVAAELDEQQEAAQQAVAADPFLAYNLEKNDWTTSSLSVVVLGASGDLAKKKIFPALFSLYYEGLLPEVSSSCAAEDLNYIDLRTKGHAAPEE